MTSFAALLAATSLHHTTDACGLPPAPEVHLVTFHFVPNAQAREFVVFGDAPQLDASAWHALAPESYDNTQIADLMDLASVQTITLVGASGAHVRTASKVVALESGWQLGTHARTALEVPADKGDRFAIAIVGDASDAKWHELESTYTRTSTLAGTDLAIAPTKDGFTVARGERKLATGTGRVIGALDYRHRRLVVVQTAKAELSTIDVGAA